MQPADLISKNKQHYEGNAMCLPVDVLSIFDSSKEDDSSKCIAEEKEKHAHNDEEALVHADYHSQQQHLQCHLNK